MGRASRIDFCCFAIPLINFGAYAVCLQCAVIALCVAILAVAPPQIVATMGALPGTFPKIIVCLLGIAILLWQVVGIIAIKREATKMYRLYIRVNLILTVVTIAATLVFFIVALARHGTAKTACAQAYGAAPAGSRTIGTSDLVGVGDGICNIFIWVQVGFMGLLIAVIGLTQLYMCALQRVYGKEMRHAERDVKSDSSDEIPLATRGSGIWDPQSADQRSYDDGYNTAPKRASGGSNNRTSQPGPAYAQGGYASYSTGR